MPQVIIEHLFWKITPHIYPVYHDNVVIFRMADTCISHSGPFPHIQNKLRNFTQGYCGLNVLLFFRQQVSFICFNISNFLEIWMKNFHLQVMEIFKILTICQWCAKKTERLHCNQTF